MLSQFLDWVFEQSKFGPVMLSSAIFQDSGDSFRISYNKKYPPASRCYSNGDFYKVATAGHETGDYRDLTEEAKKQPYVVHKPLGLARARRVESKPTELPRTLETPKVVGHGVVAQTVKLSCERPVLWVLEKDQLPFLLGLVLHFKELGYVMRVEIPGITERELRADDSFRNLSNRSLELIETAKGVVIL
jgi:hypothetical protein